MKKIRFLEWTIKICSPSLLLGILVVVVVVRTSGSSSSGYNVNITGVRVNVNSVGGDRLTAGFWVPSMAASSAVWSRVLSAVKRCVNEGKFINFLPWCALRGKLYIQCRSPVESGMTDEEGTSHRAL